MSHGYELLVVPLVKYYYGILYGRMNEDHLDTRCIPEYDEQTYKQYEYLKIEYRKEEIHYTYSYTVLHV